MPVSTFKATIQIIGINPFVFVPGKVLDAIFEQAGKDRSPIQVKGSINGDPFKQNLVRYQQEWRLYINTTMLKRSPQRIGERIEICIEFDPDARIIEAPAAFLQALNANKEAKKVFDRQIPSLQKEITRYLAKLKTPESLEKNIERAINFLLGKGSFAGREKPGK
ncbi:MAG: YdeI/OmpD-associated family protein [Chitinophagaceae bacterium]|nr:YdeI/OmpD-associated family protein [Chitinophagaceae bacterium]